MYEAHFYFYYVLTGELDGSLLTVSSSITEIH